MKSDSPVGSLPTEDEAKDLQRKIAAGSAALLFRHGASLLMGLGGIVLLTRAIGPSAYGSYIASIALVSVLEKVCLFSVGDYLTRSDPDGHERRVRASWSFLCSMAVVGLSIGFPALLALDRVLKIEDLTVTGAFALLSLPVIMLREIPVAEMHRRLAFPTIASVEFATHLAYYVVSLPLAFLGWGVWAPLIGWTAEQLIHLTLYLWVSRLPFSPRVHPDVWHDIVRFGSPLLGAKLAGTAQNQFYNPLLVGAFVGPVGVGCVALAKRFLTAAFVIPGTGCQVLSPVLRQMQQRPAEFAAYVRKGTVLIALASGFALVALDIALAYAPLVLDREDAAMALDYFPLGAVALLFGTLAATSDVGLSVLRQNSTVLMRVILTSLTTLVAGYFLVQKWGIVGFGIAEVLGLPAIGVVLLRLRALGFGGSYALPLIVCAAFVPALFHRWLGMWVLLSPLLLIAIPAIRALTIEMIAVSVAAFTTKKEPT